MGIQERKERKQLQESIYAAARTLLAEKGLEGVTIRAIAEKIDYSVRTVYLYYKDKEALLDEMRREGFEQLATEMGTIRDCDARTALFKLGKVYLRFAEENPELYKLMFQNRIEPYPLDPATEGLSSQILKQTVLNLMASRKENPEGAESAAFACWSLVHGMASLFSTGIYKEITGKERETLVREAFAFLFPEH